jgi:hypothetical protein
MAISSSATQASSTHQFYFSSRHESYGASEVFKTNCVLPDGSCVVIHTSGRRHGGSVSISFSIDGKPCGAQEWAAVHSPFEAIAKSGTKEFCYSSSQECRLKVAGLLVVLWSHGRDHFSSAEVFPASRNYRAVCSERFLCGGSRRTEYKEVLIE